jgi:lipid II:glycine glycyltransferase (peptidoglycan interpeptide bridge formation enzyme)
MDPVEAGHAGDAEWDAFVAGHPDGHPEQSSAFGRSRRRHGFALDRIALRSGGRIIGGALLLWQRTPVGKLATVLRGPLAPPGDALTMDRVVHALDRLAVRRSYASIRAELLPTQSDARTALLLVGFRPSSAWAELGERPSLVVPLSISHDDVLAQMKKRGRYNIRHAERSGVTVEVGGGPSLGEFYDLYRSTASFQAFPSFPRKYFETLWGSFGRTGKLQLFVARVHGVAVAAILNVIAGGRCYYTWGGMDRSPAYSQLCANYLLHYFAMWWARAHGCTHYDLSGTSDFKERLGLQEIVWSAPLRKCYGSFGGLRSEAVEATWRSAGARGLVSSCAARLGLRARMPY